MKRLLLLAGLVMGLLAVFVWGRFFPRLTQEHKGTRVSFRYPAGWSVEGGHWELTSKNPDRPYAYLFVNIDVHETFMTIQDSEDRESLEQIRERDIKEAAGRVRHRMLKLADGRGVESAFFPFADIGRHHPGGNLLILGPTTEYLRVIDIKPRPDRTVSVKCELRPGFLSTWRDDHLCRRMLASMKLDF